jgi:hypothetical protein
VPTGGIYRSFMRASTIRYQLRYQLRRVRRRVVRQWHNIDKADHAPLPVEELAVLLSGSGIRWRITGMHTVNHHLGWSLREPHDLDVEIDRADIHRLRTVLPDWQHYYVDAGAWFRWRGQPLPADIRRIVSRQGPHAPWCVEWLLSSPEGDTWTYRYDARIRAPWWSDGCDRHSPIVYSPPEAAFLYKSRYLREKDTEDFEKLLPHLEDARRTWLTDAIALSDPQHPWLAALRGAAPRRTAVDPIARTSVPTGQAPSNQGSWSAGLRRSMPAWWRARPHRTST